MPDLSAAAVATWLDQQDPDAVSELPDALRLAEADPRVETALVALGVALTEADSRDPGRLGRIQTDPARTAFHTVLAQLGQRRLIRLLDWLAEPGKPHRHSLLIGLFNPNAADAQAVQSAVRHLLRHRLLTRMMADERIATLLACAKPHRQTARGTH